MLAFFHTKTKIQDQRMLNRMLGFTLTRPSKMQNPRRKLNRMLVILHLNTKKKQDQKTTPNRRLVSSHKLVTKSATKVGIHAWRFLKLSKARPALQALKTPSKTAKPRLLINQPLRRITALATNLCTFPNRSIRSGHKTLTSMISQSAKSIQAGKVEQTKAQNGQPKSLSYLKVVSRQAPASPLSHACLITVWRPIDRRI